MTSQLKDLLKRLADEYEKASFCDSDPSQFLRWYNPEKNPVDAEYASFIAAMLSFGSRSQFIPKIRQILSLCDTNPDGKESITLWLKEEKYKIDFPSGEKKFYRFYSYDDMHCLFRELSVIEKKYGSLGKAVRQTMENSSCAIYEAFAVLFPSSKIVPKGANSANKRVHMFLRWMVRQDSPVDLGLWSWYSPAELLIPLDVHVMEEGKKLGLLPEKATASLKTAKLLTEQLKEVWPNDPVKGDFALFGASV